MLLFWNWKELHCGSSLERFNEVRSALDGAGITHEYKLVKHDDASPPFRSPARETLGRVGENASAATMYYVYVQKPDYEKAKYAIKQYR